MAYWVVSFGLGSRIFLDSECFLFKGLFHRHSQCLYYMEHCMERVLTHLLFILFFKFYFVFDLFSYLISAAINPYLPKTVHKLCMKLRVWNDGSLDGEEANSCALCQPPSLPVCCHNERKIRMLSSCSHGYSVFLYHTQPVTVMILYQVPPIVNFVINTVDGQSSKVISREENRMFILY